jgi:raffinose/stachyose/melibiose transport system permease protein
MSVSTSVESTLAAARVAETKRRKPSRFVRQRGRNTFGLMMVLPALILYSVFVVYPVVRGAWVSFYQWDGLSTSMTWVGWRNYHYALQDPIFRKALRNTFQYAIGVTIAKNILGLALALLLNGKLRGTTFFRTAGFLPVMFSFVVVGVLWSWIFNPTFGLADGLLKLVGLGSFQPGWLSDPHLALWSVMWVDVWKWTGFHMVLYLAALQSIPQELYEAAAIDGANGIQIWRRITLPSLRPTFVFLIVTGAFDAMSRFADLWTLGGPGGSPAGSLQSVVVYLFQTGFESGNMNRAAAIAVVLFVLMLLVTVVSFRTILATEFSGPRKRRR